MSLISKLTSRMAFAAGVALFFSYLSTAVGSTHTFQVQSPSTTTVANGLRTINVNTPNGDIIVKLPDDIRTGDTVSGSIVERPKGDTDAEREKNRTVMRSRVLRMMLNRAAGGTGVQGTRAEPIVVTVPLKESTTPTVQTLPRFGDTSKFQMKVVAPSGLSLAKDVETVVVPIDNAVQASEQNMKFEVPKLAQTGRSVEIRGPFDGKASNSKVNLTPLKGDDPPKPEDDPELDVIAESPRKAIVEIPMEFVGRSQIDIEDNGQRGTGVVRNIGVSLSAPKTSLIRGETTVMTVTVTGLASLRGESLPMTLQASGVVSMSGGMYQALTISPSQVAGDGTYVATRTITGLQAGGWGATANVVTSQNLFDLCLNDDRSTAKLILSSLGGVFESVFPDGAHVDGSSQVSNTGCTFTFRFSGKDLKLQATVDACAHTGTAEITSKKVKYTITDSNTTDNICGTK